MFEVLYEKDELTKSRVISERRYNAYRAWHENLFK